MDPDNNLEDSAFAKRGGPRTNWNEFELDFFIEKKKMKED